MDAMEKQTVMVDGTEVDITADLRNSGSTATTAIIVRACAVVVAAAAAFSCHCAWDWARAALIRSIANWLAGWLAGWLAMGTPSVGRLSDSRCILCRSGLSLSLTVDQTCDRVDEKKRVQEAGAMVVRNRVRHVDGACASVVAIVVFFLTGLGSFLFVVAAQDTDWLPSMAGVW
jgi:serine/threonine protein phosphatase PrpC